MDLIEIGLSIAVILTALYSFLVIRKVDRILNRFNDPDTRVEIFTGLISDGIEAWRSWQHMSNMGERSGEVRAGKALDKELDGKLQEMIPGYDMLGMIAGDNFQKKMDTLARLGPVLKMLGNFAGGDQQSPYFKGK